MAMDNCADLGTESAAALYAQAQTGYINLPLAVTVSSNGTAADGATRLLVPKSIDTRSELTLYFLSEEN
jgi:hypothetical protein